MHRKFYFISLVTLVAIVSATYLHSLNIISSISFKTVERLFHTESASIEQANSSLGFIESPRRNFMTEICCRNIL